MDVRAAADRAHRAAAPVAHVPHVGADGGERARGRGAVRRRRGLREPADREQQGPEPAAEHTARLEAVLEQQQGRPQALIAVRRRLAGLPSVTCCYTFLCYTVHTSTNTTGADLQLD